LKSRTAERSVVEQQIAEGKVLAPTAGRVLTVPVTTGTVVLRESRWRPRRNKISFCGSGCPSVTLAFCEKAIGYGSMTKISAVTAHASVRSG
jgi:hypothetical protein